MITHYRIGHYEGFNPNSNLNYYSFCNYYYGSIFSHSYDLEECEKEDIDDENEESSLMEGKGLCFGIIYS